jgi:hypothetical protein
VLATIRYLFKNIHLWLLAVNHSAKQVRSCYTSTYKRVEQGFFERIRLFDGFIACFLSMEWEFCSDFFGLDY